MPCDYSKYPADWKERRARILARASNRCEECSALNGAVGYRLKTGEFVPQENLPGTNIATRGYNPIQIVLTIAHLDEDGPLDCPDDRLRALCQRCHLRRDAEMHKRNASATRTKKKNEGTATLPLLVL